MYHFFHCLKIISGVKFPKKLKYISFFVFYIGFALLGMWLTSKPPSSLSVIWLPAGIGLVSAISFGRKGLILVYLASSFSNGGYGYYFAEENKLMALYSGLTSALVDLLQTWIAWRLLLVSHLLFKSPQDLLKFFFRACIIPPALTVWILPLIWYYIGGIPFANGFTGYVTKTIQILSADMLGLFLVTPLFLALRHLSIFKFVKLFVISSILLFLPVLLAVYIHKPLISLIIPVILFLVVKYRLAGSTFALTIITGILLFYMAFLEKSSDDIEWFSYFNVSLLILCLGLVPHYIALTLEQLRIVKETLELRVAERTKALQLANEQLELAANTDILTGLLNRRAFLNRFKYESDRANRTQNPYSIAILDLDHFKNINDNFGHQAGDEVLLAFSQIMISHLRTTDIACRWGGEEFLILFPDTNQAEANIPLTRIREFTEVSEDLSDETSVKLTVSIGVSDSIVSGADSIIDHADKALYAAKAAGRNTICFFDELPAVA